MAGAIPSDLGELMALTKLNLGGNALKGEFSHYLQHIWFWWRVLPPHVKRRN